MRERQSAPHFPSPPHFSMWASNNIMRHYIRDGKLAQAKEFADKLKGISQFGYH